MAHRFHVGDLIAKTRKAKNWNQARLGIEAAKYRLNADDIAIDKSTVSAVETNPFVSGLGTVLRLVYAVGLTLDDAASDTTIPFMKAESPPERRAATRKRAG